MPKYCYLRNYKCNLEYALKSIFLITSSVDATDVLDLTKAEMEGRSQAMNALVAMKKVIPGFQNAKLRNFGMKIGTRDSRKIIGR